MMRRRRETITDPADRAFSLVEMLVVTAIIALLTALLLPSLQRAREQALSVKCQAHVHAIAQAAGVYTARYGEWLPGSPGTTGAILLSQYAGRSGADEDMPVPPVQTWDFAGALAGEQMGYVALPANRGQRFKIVVNGVFECPSNVSLSMPFLDGLGPVGSFTVQRAVSYNTVRNFMMWPKATLNGLPWGAVAPFHDDGDPAGWDGNIASSSNTIIPRSFVPRIERVGQPSEKIFIADSSRYTDSQGVSHNIHWRGSSSGGSAGGAFSTGCPTLPGDILRSYLLEEPQLSYSYRHPQGKKRGLIAAFYDGHAEWRSEERTRHPDAWHPKGTIIPRDELNDATIENVEGQIATDATYIVRR